MTRSLKSLSLLWRILLSTSIALAILFAVTGWVVQTYAVRVNEQSMEGEVRTSLQSYEALWKTRARTLAAISSIISGMSDVRAAFTTGDQATIRDTAKDLWRRASQDDAIFLVLSPNGSLIASLGGDSPQLSLRSVPLSFVLKQFPAQVAGFVPTGHRLFYVVLTPVYVQSGRDEALLNILVAGFEVNQKLADSLKQLTRGSDFAFLSEGRMVASTLGAKDAKALESAYQQSSSLQHLTLNGGDYLSIGDSLTDVSGHPVGELRVVRSLSDVRRAIHVLQRNVSMIWLLSVIVGLGLTYLLARRILEPVKRLDRAASEVAHHNYDYRVSVETEDEIGRLARTFNEMCESISRAREDLVRNERMSTIGRLSTSIVHDLRNPLAAIYGGAEMLVDSDLPPAHSKRLAANIYRASRRIQELLKDLSNLSLGKTESPELCRLADIVGAAVSEIRAAAVEQNVEIRLDIPLGTELYVGRARMERVFINLMNNSLEAMPNQGVLTIVAKEESKRIIVDADDTGNGIPLEVRKMLFHPFVSAGKRNGLGLGLALSRQTMLDHGGDLLVVDKETQGARFRLIFPKSTLAAS